LSTDTVICNGDEAILEAFTDQPGTYSWSPNGASGSTTTVSPNANTTYTASFTSVCETLTGDVNVVVAEPVLIEDIVTTPPDIVEVSQDEDVTLTVELNPSGQPGTMIEWLEGGVVIGNGESYLATPLTTPMTTYSVIVTSINGCVSEDEISFTVIPPEYDLPNAFSPDGDGTNDIFKLLYKGAITLESFVVFDRWGQRVYEGSMLDAGWDGTFKGRSLPSDVYVYILKLKLPTDEIVQLSGDVTLIR